MHCSQFVDSLLTVLILVVRSAEEVEAENRRRDQEYCERGVGAATLKKHKRDKADCWLEYLLATNNPGDLDFRSISKDKQLRLIIRYIRYLDEVKHEVWEGITAKLETLKFRFKTSLIDVSVFDEPAVAMARKVTKPSAREMSLRKEERKRMPVTQDMLRGTKERYWRYAKTPADERAAMDDRMTYVGNNVGFAFLWRVSQYVLDASCRAHALMTEDINIFMKDGTVRFPWEMGDQDVAQVVRVLFVSRSSKNDKAGRGQYMYLQRKSADESELLEVIVQWCKESGVQKGDPFLCRYFDGRRKMLTRKMINTSLKEIATVFGFSSVAFAFSSHSLRIGGATTMIAAGADKERVRRLGGWAADGCCDEIYELATPLDDNALSIRSTCFRVLTAEEVHALLPPKKRALLADRLTARSSR